MIAAELLPLLTGVRHHGDNRWSARCPAHHDDNPSFVFEQAGERTLIHCHAGCTPEAICTALGITTAALFNGNGAKHSREIVATYDYTDENNALLFQVVRFEQKDFRQRKADGTWNLGGVRRVLYRLAEVLKAQYVFVVEGEKDVDALRAIRLTVTCNPGGAGKWRDEYTASLTGKHITIIPDNDEPGRRHAQQVAASLSGKAASVKILELPDLPEKGDVSDWLATKDPEGAAEELSILADRAAPWIPAEQAPKEEPKASANPRMWNLLDGLNQPREQQANPWAFDGVLARTGVGAVALDSGEGKTWIHAELGIDYAAGLPLFGVFPNRRQGPVVLLLEEDDEQNTIDRCEQLVRGKSLSPEQRDSLRHIHIINFSGLQLDTAEGLARLREIIGDMKPAYVGLDPMAEFHSQPENDATRMTANLLRPIRGLAHTFDCFINFSHHTRKGYAGQDQDQKQIARGSSALKAWADSMWFIKIAGDVLSVETKQRKGSTEYPSVPSFSLKRIPDPQARTQTWEVSRGTEDDLGLRHDAALVADLVRRAGKDGIVNRGLEDAFPKWNSKRLDAAVDYLERAATIKIEREKRPGRDGKMREQKVIRSTEEPRTTEDTTKDSPRFKSTEEPRTTPIRGFGS